MPNRIALAVFLAGATACAPAIDTTIHDAATTAAVVTALLNSPDIDGSLLDISAEAGVVRLGGTQPTADAAAQAVAIAKGVQGVGEVESAIEIEATPTPRHEPGRVPRQATAAPSASPRPAPADRR